ncbi:hypothetical protein MXF31_09215 [Mammaliicoccus sciuri]|uniref:hypothetical protein n=1 Tax=Mammaliicoccus sciuri TaxID=1296 RepID=UPI002DBBE12B|nr:hypothetical protein [Mammaliicoccus sciuri]MEB5649831.1 hypothetical protein [Mammaliicoccus sciuri]
MGVIMGKIIMHDTENQTQLILQAGDERSLEKQVEGIDMLERKAKAFDEIVIETTGVIMNCPPGVVETEAGKLTLDIIDKYEKQMEDK